MPGFPVVGELFGRYRILERLGRGGMGVVFRALQEDLGREVALKVLSPEHLDDPELRARFAREASLLAAVESPHVISVFDHGEREGCLFIASQLVPGGDLGRRLEQEGPLPPDLALDVLVQLSEGLAEAHAAGIVHRDVKPGNVLLRPVRSGVHAYLCDFGIAADGQEGLTQAGAVIGTFGYLAPERCQGERATVSSDIYALGCVLVAALTGRAPYAGTDFSVAQQHVYAPVPQWAGTTPGAVALNDVLLRSMAKDPADRYLDAEQMRTELVRARHLTAPDERVGPVLVDETVVRARPTPPAPPAVPAPAARRRGRRPALVGALVALALAVTAVGGYAVTRSGDDGSAPRTTAAAASPSAAITGAPTAQSAPRSSTPRPRVSSAPTTAAAQVEAPAPDPTPIAEPEPEPERTFPQRDLGCTGEYVVVLATKVGPRTSFDQVEDIMARFDSAAEHAQYADAASSCSNLSAMDDKGAARWVPFLGTFPDAGSACRARLQHGDSSTYVAELSDGATDPVYCACMIEERPPVLDTSTAGQPSEVDRMWVLGVQNLLRDVGLAPDAFTGAYKESTTARVEDFQREQSLPVTGTVDGETWDLLRSLACELS